MRWWHGIMADWHEWRKQAAYTRYLHHGDYHRWHHNKSR